MEPSTSLEPFNLLENLPDDILLHTFAELNPIDLCRMCQVSKYLQAVAEDEWLWRGIVRDILVPDDELMPPMPLPKATRPPSAVDVIGPRASYSLLGPFYHSNSLAPPQHHTRRFQYHQSRGPWWKSVFKRHKTFLRDSSIPVICYRTMSYPPVANCVRAVRGPLIAVAGWKDIRLVNFRTGSVTKMLRGHSNFVNCLSGGCGGNILVSGSDDGTVLVWDTGLTTGDAFVTAQFEYQARVRAVVYEPTNNLVLFSGDNSEIHIHKLGPHGESQGADAVSILPTDDWGIRSLDYDPSTNLLIAAGDNTAQVYTLNTLRCILRVPAPSMRLYNAFTRVIRDVKFIDSTSFIIAQNTILSVLDLRSGRIIHQLEVPKIGLTSVGITSVRIVAARYAVCAIGIRDFSSNVIIFDLKERKLVRELGGHVDGVKDLAIVADHLVTAGSDGMIKVWRAMEDKSAQMKRHEKYLRTQALDRIYKLLCIADHDEEEY